MRVCAHPTRKRLHSPYLVTPAAPHGALRKRRAAVAALRARLPLSLGRQVAVDVLVEATVSGTQIAAPGAAGERAALVHVGCAGVLVFACLARIGTGYRVVPVGPRSEREIVQRADVQVVARERYGAVVELLVVRVRAVVAQPRLARPRSAEVVGNGRPGVERRRRGAVGAVADGASRAVARIEATVPPDDMHGAARRDGWVVGRDVREDLMPGALV